MRISIKKRMLIEAIRDNKADKVVQDRFRLQLKELVDSGSVVIKNDMVEFTEHGKFVLQDVLYAT